MTEMAEPIEGKVARILNSRELAINIGQEQGVAVGMKFDVMDPKGEDILDPETGEILGSLRRAKVRVKVTRADERLSVARTFRSTRVNVGGAGFDARTLGAFQDLFKPAKWITKHETLATREKTWDDLGAEESYVSVGDPVEQVIENEEDLES